MHRLRQLDGWIFGSAAALMGMGLLAIFSVTNGTPRGVDVWKQAMFIGIALAIIGSGAFFDYRAMRARRGIVMSVYAVGLVLLAGLFAAGVSFRGARAWYRFGPLSFQPVELMKIALVALLAKYFALRHGELYRLRHIVVSGLYVAFPAALVLLQPDAGSVLLMVALWAGFIIMAGVRFRAFIGLVALVAVAATALWMYGMQPYQRERVLSFVDPLRDPQGIGYQRRQAVIAVGGGGFWGWGFGAGPQSQSGRLPESHTDFVFATIAEEWGFAGAAGVLGVYMFLMARLVWWARRAPNNFARLGLMGVALLLFVQWGLNVAMNIGLAPVVGIPLPLVSYGGSNMVMTAAALGGAQSIIVHSRRAATTATASLGAWSVATPVGARQIVSGFGDGM